MRQGFPQRCYTCGGWGHKASECANNRPVLTIHTLPADLTVGAVLNSIMRPAPAFGDNQQQASNPDEANATSIAWMHNADQRTVVEGLNAFKERTGIQDPAVLYMDNQTAREAEAQHRQAAAFLAAGAAGMKRLQDAESKRHLDIASIPFMTGDNKWRPRRRQGQSGSGALLGDAQPKHADAGAANIGRSGHGGFAGAGGSGGDGGGRQRPWRRGDGPIGHRNDARVQKNTDRGRGRGRGGKPRGGGRGGMGPARANALHTWEAGKTDPQQHVEGVNFGSRLNESGSGPQNEDGRLAVEEGQRARPMRSDAMPYGSAVVENGQFVVRNLEERDIQPLIARASRTQPSGPTWDARFIRQRHPDRDGPATSEVARSRHLTAMLLPGDPFLVNRNVDAQGRRAPAGDAAQSADTSIRGHIRKESGDAMDYEDED
ncbi:hypothetical protein KVR01_013200 [Diaporthe batatas]|uniref:uncharacterized protein n=1 Tax=Diaporthe batatas TaxID=748121 RepID=UPI001D04BB2D|nr:uncharacterized protein KVR01_013200 [Diaporthe batatas]KAG8156978.1 hypothetical protein KVR01_013200 [Diaporthe batatas]